MKAFLNKLCGGIRFTWPRLIAYAVGAAVLTAVFLIFPVFEGTSFNRMGVYLEAWIFLAVLIMANCKTPLESALKTFVFFLISQPLIYLLQVPFSSMGWGLFGFYKTWFILTLLTFPAAYVGWYITKKNWLSLLILAPVLAFLGTVFAEALRATVLSFPRLLITALFCLGQILLYLYLFTSNSLQKLAGLLIALAGAAFLLLTTSAVDINSAMFLPDDPVLTEAAVVTVDDGQIAEVSVESTGQDSMVRIRSTHLGTTSMTVRDGENEYRYLLTIYLDHQGAVQVEIKPRDD